MRIGIIGGAGFIGSAIAAHLGTRDADTCILDTEERLQRSSERMQGYDTRIFPFPGVTDLLNQFRGFETLVHLACTTEPASSMESMVSDAETNIIPALKIFQAAFDAGVKRIVYASSGGTVYGNPVSLPVHEDNETKPICAYGVSKLAIEQYLNLFAANFPLTGISLRIGNPYGTHQLEGTTIGIIAHYLNSIKTGRPIEVWGDGTIVRDYLPVDCVARAFGAAIFTPSMPSASYNIGSGTGVSINELIELLFKISGKRVPVKYFDPRGFDVPKIILDSSRFESLTDWRPILSLEEGVAGMWLRLNG